MFFVLYLQIFSHTHKHKYTYNSNSNQTNKTNGNETKFSIQIQKKQYQLQKHTSSSSSCMIIVCSCIIETSSPNLWWIIIIIMSLHEEKTSKTKKIIYCQYDNEWLSFFFSCNFQSFWLVNCFETFEKQHRNRTTTAEKKSFNHVKFDDDYSRFSFFFLVIFYVV